VCVGIDELVDKLMSQVVHEGEGGQLMKEWDCLRSYVAAYEQTCGTLTSYAARHTRVMANLCNAGLGEGTWHAALLHQCGAPQ
jgi:legumain